MVLASFYSPGNEGYKKDGGPVLIAQFRMFLWVLEGCLDGVPGQMRTRVLINYKRVPKGAE